MITGEEDDDDEELVDEGLDESDAQSDGTRYEEGFVVEDLPEEEEVSEEE